MPKNDLDRILDTPYLAARRSVGSSVASPGGGSGGSVPNPHALDSVYHTGEISNAQGPQFLLTSGVRNLTGNLGVDSGITIDGVDLSAHVLLPDIHHDRVTVGNTGLSLSTQVLSLNLATDPGLEISSGLRIKNYHGINRDSNGLWIDLETNSGLALDADGLALGAPTTLTYATTNNVTGAAHAHAITASSNVGSAGIESLLKSDASGNLALADLTLYGDLIFTAADRLVTATHDLTFVVAEDILFNADGNIYFADDQNVRSVTYQDLVTGINGFRLFERPDAVDYWQLTMGAAKFDELYTRVFVADEVRIDRGEEYWSKSFGIVETDFILPALSATVDVWFENSPAMAEGNIFTVNDWLMIRIIDLPSGHVALKCWFQVTSLLTAGSVDGERQQWRLTRKKFGTTGVKIKKGVVMLDAGQPGQGWLHLSALNQDGGPFFQVGIFDEVVDDEPIFTNHVRMGRLDDVGLISGTDVWGLAAGNDLADGDENTFSGFTVDATDGLRLYNTEVRLHTSGTLTSFHGPNQFSFLRDVGELGSLGRWVRWNTSMDDDGNGPGLMWMGAFENAGVASGRIGMARTVLNGADPISFEITLNDFVDTGNITLGLLPDLFQIRDGDVVKASINTDGQMVVGTSSFTSALRVYEDTANTGSSAGITLEQDGAGDAVLRWVLSSVVNVYSGIDNTDDVWKLSAGTHLGDAPALAMYPSTGKVGANTLRAMGATGLGLEDDGGNLALFIEDGGLIGIGGITDPDAALEIKHPSGGSRLIRTTAYGAAAFNLIGRRALGTVGTPTKVVSGSVLVDIAGLGYTDISDSGTTPGWATNQSGEIHLISTQDFDMGIDEGIGADWRFLTVNNNTAEIVERLKLGQEGVTLGLDQFGQSRLTWTVPGEQSYTMGIDIDNDNQFLFNLGATQASPRIFKVDATTGDITFYNFVGFENDVIFDANVTMSGTTTGPGGTESMHNAATDGDGINVSLGQVVSVDSTVVRETLQILSGDGLAGGGDLSANRTLYIIAGSGIDVDVDGVSVNSTVVRTTLNLIAGAGLAGGGLLSADRTFDVGAGAGITVNTNDVALASSVAGAGLTYTTGVLDIGAGAGISVAADAVAIALGSNSALNTSSGLVVDSSIAGAGLTMTTGVVNVIALATGGLTVNANDMQIKLPSPSGLVTDATGLYIDDAVAGAGLTMTSKVLNVIAGDTSLTVAANELHVNLAHAFTWSAVHTFTANPDIQANLGFSGGARSITGSGNITIAPVGDLILSPAGLNVLPTGSGEIDIGDYNRKFRTIYASELYVETLVKKDVWATVGGRIMVAGTSSLIADMTTVQTTIDMKEEITVVDETFIRLQTAPAGVPQVEVMKITAVPATVIAGGFRYTVTRNVDGSGANAWVIGDAVVTLGAAVGDGYLELTSTASIHGHLGPTVTVYARTAITNWNDVKPVVTMGNLSSFVDYGATEFGFAVGNDLTLDASTGFSGATVDRTDGLRLFNTAIELYDTANKVFSIDKTDGITLEKAAGSSEWFSSIRWYNDLASPSNELGSIRLIRDGANLFNALYLQAGAGGNAAHRGFISLNTSTTTGELTLDIDPSIGFNFRTTIGGSANIVQFLNSGDMVLYGDSQVIGASRIDGLLDARGNASVDGNLDVVGTLYVGNSIRVSRVHFYEDTATTTEAAGVTIEQDGAGDSLLQFLLTGGQRWMVGIDNSDGDKFKIGDSTDLATSPSVVIDPATNIVDFPSGISVGTTDTYAPAITGSTTNPTVSYTTQAGRYAIIAGVCFYNFNITINTISGGSGNVRISMPVTSAATYVSAAIPELSGVDLNGVSAGVYIRLGAGSASGRLVITVDNAGAAETLVSGLAAGDIINAFGAYFV